MNNRNIILQKGFSLIEIMVTVAILGILSAIALPSYTESVKKGKRSDAKVELLRLAQMQESYFVQNLSYAKDLDTLGFGAGVTQIISEKGLYKITLGGLAPAGCGTVATPCTAYEFSAVPVVGEAQEGDTKCSGFRIDNISRKWAIGTGSTAYPAGAPSTAQKDKAKYCW